MIPNYEYKVENLDTENLDELEKRLNFLGKDGWELTSVDSDNIGIFKRRELYFVKPQELAA